MRPLQIKLTVPFRALEPSNPDPFSEAFITNIAESSFRHTQRYLGTNAINYARNSLPGDGFAIECCR